MPTILLMEKHPQDNPVLELFRDPTGDGKLEQVLDMINNSGVVEECYAVIAQYCENAVRCLDTLPDCDAKRSLAALPEYIRSGAVSLHLLLPSYPAANHGHDRFDVLQSLRSYGGGV